MRIPLPLLALLGFVAAAAAAAPTAPPATEADAARPPAAAGGPPAPPAVIGRVSEKPVHFSDLPAPRRFTTHHRASIGRVAFSYTATAGETYITNASGEPIAAFFSFGYVKDDPVDPKRAVMFIFNGGPGSASLWLHLGAFGPKRVILDRGVNPSNTPPFLLADSPDSILDVADLVFIDPVGTGFSHALGNARDADFASVDADADSVARFIEAWLSENGRWNSPKYLLGESYGTVRAAVLSRALVGGPFYTTFMRGITLDGIVLVGAALDGGSKAAPGIDAAATLDPEGAAGRALPGLAAAAAYHARAGTAGRAVAAIYDDAKAFGAHEYTDALHRLKDGRLSKDEQDALATRLAGISGLAADAWLKADLKIPPAAAAKQLLAAQGLEIGLYDARYTLPLAGSDGDPVADDPAMTRYVPGFIAAFHGLLRDDLKVEMPIPYSAIAFGFAFHWDYSRTGVPESQTYAGDLANSMRRNPRLRVLVCSGYYDLVTPPAAAEHAIVSAQLPAERVTFKNYESGHMLYLGGSAGRFAEDVRAFIAAAPR